MSRHVPCPGKEGAGAAQQLKENQGKYLTYLESWPVTQMVAEL